MPSGAHPGPGDRPGDPVPRRRRHTPLQAVSDHVLYWAIREGGTRGRALRSLGLEPSASLYQQVAARLDARDWDLPTFSGQDWNRGRRGYQCITREEVEAKLVRGRLTRTSGLRKQLVDTGIFEHRCSRCLREEWQEEPIPLELDHINGDRYDNRLQNLRLLCPNCHALTPTYRGRNIGRAG